MAASFSIAKLSTYWVIRKVDDPDSSLLVKDVCAGSCRLLHVQVTNAGTPLAYLKLFNKINPVLGTDAPDEVIECVGSATEGGITDIPIHPSKGLLFSAGLSFVLATTGGTAGATPPVAACTAVLHVQPGSD